VCDPCVDDLVRNAVIAKRLDQYLPAARELSSEDAVGTMCLIERSPAVTHRTTEVLSCMLELEALDPISIGTLKKEADHRIVEAAVDEVVNDSSQLRFSAELLEVAHSSRTLVQCGARIKFQRWPSRAH
jgi:hypothetical protein